jgi:hypothetical protein
MKTRIFIAMLLTVACSPASSQEPAPKASLQVCNEATRDYDAAVRNGDAAAAATARTRVLKECYQGSGRTPVLQKPISIGADHKADAPVKPAPATPTIAVPSEPSVLTTCDGGGCWDNLGRRYNYNGTGPTLIGPTGRLCVRSGDRIECP